MLNTISIHINHHIHNQFFLRIILNNEIIMWTIKTQKDTNNPIGYTQSNFVRALLSDNARIAKEPSVGAHIKLSHKVRNNQKIINAFAMDKKSISTRIFLFSVLFMLEKKIVKHIRVAISNPTKWKLKFCGLNIDNRAEPEDGR